MEVELPTDQPSIKSPEELAQIAFLDELRAADYAVQPERSLAVVVKVSSVRDVPKAGEQYALAAVSVGTVSWLVCLPRGMVKSRQRALFVSEDAILPMEERYMCGNPLVVKQQKIKGGVPILTPVVRRHIYRANQGVLFPITSFPELKKNAAGDVVADVLHIRSVKQLKDEKLKRIADELARSKAKKVAKKAHKRDQYRDSRTLRWRENYEIVAPAPDFVQVTALDPIEESPELFEQYTDCLFEVTEKLCGVNLSVFCDRSSRPDSPIGVCVNGQEIKDSPNEFHWSLIRRFGVEAALLKCSHDLVIEGVVVGPGIRGGRFTGYRTNEFRIFDIYDITEEQSFPPVKRKVFCKEFQLLHVPIIAYHQRVFAEYPTLEDIRAYANGRTYFGYPRRGIVLRSEDESLDVWVQVGNPNFCERKCGVSV